MSAMGCSELLFDTNAVLDFCCPTSERVRHDSVAKVVTQAFIDDVDAFVPIQSLNDAYYILRRMGRTHEEGLRAIKGVISVFLPVGLLEEHALAALESGEPDFEDGLIRAQAESLGVDAIVTADRAAFAKSAVPHMTAEECLLTFWPDEVGS